MTRTQSRVESNPNDVFINGTTYYPFGNFHGINSMHISSAQPNPQPLMRPCYPGLDDRYSTVQYIMTEPGYGAPRALPQPPPPPPPRYCHAPPQTFYKSWHGYNPSSGQQMHYPLHSPMPKDAQGPKTSSFKKCKDAEVDEFETEDENLALALDYIRRNPLATLFGIEGIIPDIARANEDASNFILKRLEVGSFKEKRLGLTAILASIDNLLCNQYGNIVLQGLFEFGSAETKKELMDAIYAQNVAALCFHKNGCRVIQKAIQSLGREDACRLFTKFHDKVLPFTRDYHGNHVIQICIETISSFAEGAARSGDPDLASSLSDKMQFIIDDMIANIEHLSTHRHGCRVVQRAIEHCVDQQKNAVLESIISCHKKLVTDRYGKYVMERVLVYGSETHRTAILETLTEDGALLSLSKHKYASNIVESVLQHGESRYREKVLEEMLKDTRGDDVAGCCCLIELSKDPIANYVVSKAIEVSESDQKDRIVKLILSSHQELSKSPYAKYVLQQIAICDK